MVSQKFEQTDEDFIAKATQQSKKGQYLTPIVVADRLAQDLLDLSLSPIKEIHDLGCGPGGLSSAVLRFHSDIRILGYDIDQSAITEYNQRFLGIGNAEFRDLLIEPSIGPLSAVICNPPYLLSRRIGKERTSEIRNRGYFKTATGKLNTFSLFIELALRELCENGVAAFIIPIGITNLKDHEAIRKLLSKECEEIRLTWMTESNCFKEQNVSVDTCLLSFRKGKSKTKMEIREWNGSEIIRARNINTGDFDFFPTIDYIDLPQQIGIPLSSKFDVVAMGFNWKKNWQEIVSEAPEAEYGKEVLPVVRGKDVSKQGELEFNQELNYNYLKEKGAIVRPCNYSLHSSNRPRLIVADITSGIKVAYTNSPCLPMNSVKIIFHQNDDPISLNNLREYLMSEDAYNRLKEGAPNLHLTKGNLERLRIPEWGDDE